MKGIVLAGGRGIRLRPLTHIISKEALPVYNKPMFFYSIKNILDSGLEEIIIVINSKFGDQIKNLVDAYPGKITAKVRFCVQTKQMGLVDALQSALSLIGSSDVFVCAGDNIIDHNFSKVVKSFESGAVAFLKEVDDPERFGTPRYSDQHELVEIVEKPRHPQTKYAVVAPYIFDKKVFRLIKSLFPSARGELEITDLLNLYLKANELKLYPLKAPYFDTGTFDSLVEANNYVRQNKAKFFS